MLLHGWRVRREYGETSGSLDRTRVVQGALRGIVGLGDRGLSGAYRQSAAVVVTSVTGEKMLLGEPFMYRES